MKGTLLIIVVAITAPVILADQAAPPPMITTTGSAQIRVVPDLADLCFEVQVRNADLTVARKQQAERATKVLGALRAGGITEAELQSSQVQIAGDYTDRRQESEKLKFYSVSQNICCTLHDLKKLTDITTDAVTAGATGVRDADLRTSELRKYRDEARAKAIQAAKEKAIALAADLGSKIGKPYAITEGSNNDWRRNTANSLNMQVAVTEGDQAGDGTTPTFAPGTISVTANITVSFLLE